MEETEILVIGAGLAGLRCADVLAAAGREVLVWEASDAVGGRIRTDVINGFRCDRGFQVLNPAYPELRHTVDLAQLRLQPFGAGVIARRDEGSAVWVHPIRHPKRVLTMLSSGGVRARDVIALARWASPALRPKKLTAPQHWDVNVSEALDRAGVSGDVRRVVDRFLAGVLLEESGASSNAFTLLLARMFALGLPALPADGMQALPSQLADRLGKRIALQHRAIRVVSDTHGSHVQGDAGSVRAQHVVVATDAVAATPLTGEAAPQMHGVVTDWWASDQSVPGPPMLRVDARRGRGPVLNTAVISAAAPTYAPPGQHLIAASALVRDGTVPDEHTMRQHAADILQTDHRDWVPVTRHVIPGALPAQHPPLRVRRPIRTPAGTWLCGDHRDSASIQGALVSGRRTGEAILQAIGANTG